jgi:hypothetical protein
MDEIMATGQYNDTISSAATYYGVPPSWMLSLINKGENDTQNVNAVSPSGVQGLAQITKDTWAQYNPGVPYSTDPNAQIDTSTRIMAGYYNSYGPGNSDSDALALATAAYNGGTGVGNYANNLVQQGVPVAQAIAQATAHYYPNNPNKVDETLTEVSRVTGTAKTGTSAGTSTGSSSDQYGDVSTGQPDAANAVAALPVAGSTISADQLAGVIAAIQPKIYTDEGLNDTPWWKNKNLINNGGPTNGISQPVVFTLYTSQTDRLVPLTIKLKASLANFSKNMKHITNVEPTRTATLVNLWGMQADTIEGSGSTGLFVNQAGVSDYLSMSNVTPEYQQAILSAIGSGSIGAIKLQAHLNSNPDSLRMAAKDAFMELLALFRNDGVVWFQKQAAWSPTQQVGADAWSAVTGSTSYQNNARNNDVWTRVQIGMHYKGSTYYGFFKALTFKMDAQKPFHWNFNFTFQVERTISNVYTPV